tara:strand:+ start:465 stop:641 length:177 start_codon:yes stop_codon:yes gene_type:complete
MRFLHGSKNRLFTLKLWQNQGNGNVAFHVFGGVFRCNAASRVVSVPWDAVIGGRAEKM